MSDRKRENNYVPFEDADKLRLELGYTGGVLATKIGYKSGSSWNDWQKAGRVPTVAYIAMKGLLESSSGTKNQNYFVSVPGSDAEFFKSLLVRFGFKHTVC